VSLPTLSAASARAGAVLTIDLAALVGNWLKMKSLAPAAETGAVVKADAYGLGAVHVAPALARAGCKTFFVAHLDEGIALRAALPQARIFVLHGPNPGTEADFAGHSLIPVLNAPHQVAGWAAFAKTCGKAHPAALQVDTGMTRLGLNPAQFEALLADSTTLKALSLCLLVSHFACADTPEHPMSGQQIARFTEFSRRLPGVERSLSASSGILLGPAAQFDLTRPGIALYGGNPGNAATNPMRPVVTLSAKILQIHAADAPQTVGYGATHALTAPTRVATVALGYADGLLRGISNPEKPVFGTVRGTFKARMIGRISMDLAAFDIGEVPEGLIAPGDSIDVIGKYADIDALAGAAGTISYELLTRLGPRLLRVYANGSAP
jgi:alanine racemase